MGTRLHTKRIPMRLLIFLACVLPCLHAGAAPRNRTSFDFDWRFVLGNPTPGSCSFPTPLASDIQCLGLEGHAHVASAAECQEVCCAQGPGCLLWQYAASPGCWTGATCTTPLPATGWTGAARNASGPLNCTAGTPCDPAYDDSAWRSLAVPHDFVIEGTFSSGKLSGPAVHHRARVFARICVCACVCLRL